MPYLFAVFWPCLYMTMFCNKKLANGSACFTSCSPMSQILAMNFCPFTTRGHSPITWTFTPHSYRSLIDCISHHPLHQHSCSHWSRLHLFTISQSPSPNHTHTHTHTLLSSGLSPTLCRVLFSLATLPSVSQYSQLDFLCSDSCPCSWIILSA